MKKSIKILSLIIAVVMLCTAFAGCGKKKGSDSKILTIQIGPDPETIDPALNSSVDGGNMLLFAFDCLLNVDENNKIVAGAAENWSVSDDGLVWTFNLRKDLKWSNGDPLTAEDFVYSWKRVADPATAAPYGETVLGMVAGYDEAIGFPNAEGVATQTPNPDALKVEAKDATTFVVTLSYPCAYFDKLAAFATLSPVNKNTIEANKDAWATSPETYICNGPFKITEWVPGSYILFSKNENYRDKDRVKLDGIKCLLIEDATAAYNAYQSGTALMIKDVPTGEIKKLREDNNPEFYIDPIMGTYYISLNDQLPQFSDPKVRTALSLAIDRKYVAESLMDGTYSAAGNYIGTGITDWDGSAFMANANGGKPYIDVNDHAGNLAKAKQLLAEAGYPNGEGFPTIVYSTNDAGYHKMVAEYLQQAWKELGITTTIEVVEWKAFTPMRRAGDYQASRNGWVYDYNDPTNMLDLMISTNGNNDGKYNNPEFDAMMDKAAKETDPKTRFSYLHQAEDIMMADMSCIPVAYYNDFYLQSSKITGAWHSPYGYWYFMYADIAE